MRWRFKSDGVVAASLLAILALAATPARSQLYDNRVIDKAFEENGLFFKSGLINPYGISGFGDAASGFIQHPLLDLQQNPALAASDSIGTVFGYLDFRRSTPTQPEYYGYGGCPYCRGIDLAVADIRYPYYGGYEREALRPLLGAALLGRPFGAESPFVTGVSYQLIFRDEQYYRVPFDIYRSAAAFDFTGARQAEVADPFVNGSTGENAMRTSGHLVNVHAATQSGSLSAGARVGLTRQNIDGSVGSQNSWGGGSATDRSLWSDLEERTQSYDHLDVELGIGYAVTPGVRVGVSAGALFGTATQELARTDTSFYANGLVPPGQYRRE